MTLTTHSLGWCALLACFHLAAGCAGDNANAPSQDAGAAYVTELRSLAELQTLSAAEVVAGVKYLAPIVGKPALQPLTAECYLQNMHRYPWHLQFLQSFPELAGVSFESYRSWVLRKATRRLWGGTLQYWPAAQHPMAQRPGVVSYSVYAEPGGLSADDVVEAHARMQRCAAFAREQLVFVPDGPDQVALVELEGTALAERGVASVLPSMLSGDVDHVVYSAGEAYGYLRVITRGQALSEYAPRDIVIVDSAPNDISLVSGLLTVNPQNELGHVNLRLREKGIPNASMPAVYDAAWLSELDSQLVHLTVSDREVQVTAAEATEAEAYWQQHRPALHKQPRANLDARALRALHDIRAGDSDVFGAKCANLGELTQVLSAPHRPDGFAVPFAYYRAFSRQPPLAAAIDMLLDEAALGTDARRKRAALADLRDLIRDSALSDDLSSALRAAVDSAFGQAGYTKFLRVRSSSNVEDLGELTGAGLYDSRSGCLADDLDDDDQGPSKCLTDDKRSGLETQLRERQRELAEHPERTYLSELIDDIGDDLRDEKPLATAVRKVYASLWNERAFDERDYYGISQLDVYMGLCVHPSFELEQINAVAVSNLHVDDGAPLYRLSSQVGELSVAQPEDPTASAELVSFRRTHRDDQPDAASDIQLQTPSSLRPNGEQVWPRDKLLELAQLLFQAHDHFAREVYPDIAPLSLDFEVKLDRNAAVSIKQVRPYARAAGGL